MKLSRSIERQLQKIEQAVAQREEAASPQMNSELAANIAAYDRLVENYFSAIDELIGGMPEHYQRLADQGLEHLGYEGIMADRDGDHWSGPAEAFLAKAVCLVAGRFTREHFVGSAKTRGPLAFPESLCEWIVEHGEGLRGGLGKAPFLFRFDHHDCEDCGFWVPAAPGGYYQCRDARAAGPSNTTGMPFPACPVCGGATGWIGYAIKHATPGGFGSSFKPYSQATSTCNKAR